MFAVPNHFCVWYGRFFLDADFGAAIAIVHSTRV